MPHRFRSQKLEDLRPLVFSLKPSVIFFSILLLFFLFGCGYTIQKKADLPFDTVWVGNIENKTVEPKLQDSLSRHLSETFMEYGFKVKPQAQYVIEGDIISFKLEPLVEKDLIAAQYRVTIKANLRIKDIKSSQTYPIHIESPFVVYFGSFENLEKVLIAKDSATDKAIKDLAHEVIRFIIYKKYFIGS